MQIKQNAERNKEINYWHKWDNNIINTYVFINLIF